MTDMSQNEQPQGLRSLFAGGLDNCRSLLRRHRPQSPQRVAHGTAAADVNSRAAGATSLWRMRTTVTDEPGTLAALCGAFAREGVDIVSLQTFPLGLGPAGGGHNADGARADATAGDHGNGDHGHGDLGHGDGARAEAAGAGALAHEQAMDEFVVRAPGRLQAGDLVRMVNGAGGVRTRVERADAHDLVDAPTRALRLAARTARDTAELPLALRQLLGRCTVRSVPPVSPYSGAPSTLEVPPEGTCEETVLRLPDPAGGVLVVERPQLPFTPAEFARAAALVELDRVVGAGVRVPRAADRLTLPDGWPVTVRRADPGDLHAALAMHERCSRTTLERRYHGPVSEADRYLRHLLSPRFGRTLAAWTASGRLVALGHLLWDGEESEVALIVEDDWQHRGIGSELLCRLVELAREAGSADVYAVTQSSNTAMVASMRRLGLPLDHQVEDRTLVISARLDGDGTGSGAESGAGLSGEWSAGSVTGPAATRGSASASVPQPASAAAPAASRAAAAASPAHSAHSASSGGRG